MAKLHVANRRVLLFESIQILRLWNTFADDPSPNLSNAHVQHRRHFGLSVDEKSLTKLCRYLFGSIHAGQNVRFSSRRQGATLSDPNVTLAQVRARMRELGARELFAKRLSPNDNSKNQIYLGGDFRVINLLPAGAPVAATSGTHGKPIFKASLRLDWLDDVGRTFPAPAAQLILYPQYPEVRMSGFLKGAEWSPSDLLASRDEGRVLLLGVSADGRSTRHHTFVGPALEYGRQGRVGAPTYIRGLRLHLADSHCQSAGAQKVQRAKRFAHAVDRAAARSHSRATQGNDVLQSRVARRCARFTRGQ